MNDVCLMHVKTKTLLGLALLLLLNAAGCAPENVLQEVTETELTAAGGLARSFDGLVEVEIPSGAIAQSARLRITTVRDLTSPELISAPYDLELIGATLIKPAELRIKVETTEQVMLARLEGVEAVPVENAWFDEAAGKVGGTLTHFSRYAAMRDLREHNDAGIVEDAAEEEPDAGVEEADAESNQDAESYQDAETHDAEPHDAVADPHSDGGSACTHADAGVVMMSGVDLAFDCLPALTGPWQAGSTQSFTFDVVNLADQPAAPNDLVVLLSSDQTITAADPILATFAVPMLAGGASTTFNATFNVPAALAPGSYYVALVVDGASVVTELSEQNNIARLGPVTITP